jgi:hypothetical protein
VYKTGVPIRFFIFFMSCLTAMMPLGCHIGDLWGKQEERRPGILKSEGLFGMWLLWKRETHSIYQMRQRSMYLKFRKEFVLGS